VKKFLSSLVYYPFIVVVFVVCFAYYTLVAMEAIARHNMCRYIRLWKQEIDQ